MEESKIIYLSCSRCATNILEPKYVCENLHLACDSCKKVFCQICRHIFEDKGREIERGEINISPIASPKRIRHENPYQPNNGTIQFEQPFLLPKQGICKFHAKIPKKNFTFSWNINPQEGIIEVRVAPKQLLSENWFIIEFSSPLHPESKVRKEWALNSCLAILYDEIQGLYENDTLICKISVREVPYGAVVKPMEDKIKDAIVSLFKSKNRYEAL